MCVAVAALLLLSQKCTVFVMQVAVKLWIGKDNKEVFFAEGRENINKNLMFFWVKVS